MQKGNVRDHHLRIYMNSGRTASRMASAFVLFLSLTWGAEIHDAARDGDSTKIRTLIQANPEMVSKKDDGYGATPLHWAAAFGHKEVAVLLLAKKAPVNAKANNGRTPLHYAASAGQKDLVELLLANGAEITPRDNDGRTPFQLAANNEKTDVADLLRKNNGEVIEDIFKPSPPPPFDQVGGWIEGLRSPDSNVRFEAAIKLGSTKEARVVAPLISALQDSDSFVRMQVAGSLGKMGLLAIDRLIAALRNADTNVRIGAAYALGEIKDSRVVEPLIAALKDENETVRSNAAMGLGKLRDPRAIEDLLAAGGAPSATPRYWESQRNANDALLSIGEPAVEPLIAVLNNNTDWQVRRNAAMVLGGIKIISSGSVMSTGTPTHSQDPRAVARLLRGLRERDSAVIIGAIRFFIGRAESESEEILIQALDTKGDREVAVDFLNCGNLKLEAAANRWASEHSYKITTLRGTPSLQWGSLKP